MSRWFSPVVLLGTAAWVYQHNATSTASIIVIPFADRLAGPNPIDQGQVSWQVILGLGVGMAVWAFYDQVRARPDPDAQA